MYRLYLPILLIATLTVILANACKNAVSSPEVSIADADLGSIPDEIDFSFHVKPILSDRCFKCHGPDAAKIEGGLQLHTAEKAMAALGEHEDRHAIVAGNLDESTLIQRIYSDDPDDMMPPPESNLTLSPREKSILARWVEQGAKWKQHWAFELPTDPPVPAVINKDWPSNPIDHYILAKLEENNLAPTKALEPEKLLRKLSFDLTGLPPTLEDIAAYRGDPSQEHYARLVDKYLDSDAFAELMTNQWLDLARYADTHGYQDDLERIMWPWRDWVIHAFRQNMPYDQFVTWQLAGDLMPEATKEQLIATAFNRNHKITQEGGAIPEEYRAEYVSDRTNTFATAFLGLTFECAKCHDHKYDPISQKEYYQLFGYFNSVAEEGLIETYGAIPEPYINITKEEIADVLTFINNIEDTDTIPLMVMGDLPEPRQTHILNRGLYDQLGTAVEPGLPSFGRESTGQIAKDRLELAEWLFGDTNPLTARVTVNRLWQQIFGQGIVTSSYDFGNQGSLPTHPELLDHLAEKFKKDGWDVQELIRYMVSTATYKQAANVDPSLLAKDPANLLLARSSRTRLSAEMLRDHALAISGLLVSTVGGPSVKPYQPPGLWSEVAGGGSVTTYTQDTGDKNYRRSLYTYWKRAVPPPNMLLFDTPTRDMCMVKRENTSTPLQALVLMNDPQFLEASKALAARAVAKTNTDSEDVQATIQYMFTLATSRPADEEEMETLSKLYEEQLDYFQKDFTAAKQLLSYGEYALPESYYTPTMAAYSFIANTIFNLDETIRKT